VGLLAEVLAVDAKAVWGVLVAQVETIRERFLLLTREA
jgi:hypothetical protein